MRLTAARRPARTAFPLLATALLALPAGAARAQQEDEPIVTDRPDYVESSKVVGKGRLQVETSLLTERDRNSNTSARTLYTPTLLRYGVGDDLELRLETDGRTVAHLTDPATGARSTIAGYSDIALGVKWHMADPQGSMPSVGLLVHADLPTGSAGFKGQGTRPSLRVAAEWELADGFSLGVMPGVGLERNDEGGRYGFGSLGIVLGKSFSDRLRGYVELSLPQIASGGNGGTQATFDVGTAWLVSKNVQVDTAFTRGLNNRTPDWSWTVGLSFRR